jgi:hypothetical protein
MPLKLCDMKLFLTWLLGVPLLVTSMVMAQSLLLQNHDLGIHATPGTHRCASHGKAHDVAPLVTQQGYGVSCNRLTVQ